MRYVSQIKIIFILFISSISFAGTPTVTTFQTRITTPSGAALEAASVNFRFTILDSAGTCALYVEDYANVNMSGSSGIVSFSLGAGAKQYPAGLVSMYEVFNNSAPSFPCQAGGTYVPGPTDRRQIVMQFNDGSGWQTLPQLAINSVFYSNYAIRSENLGSYPANDYLRPVTLPTCTASQSLRWDGTTFTCITAGGGGGGSMTGVTSISNASGDISLAAASGTGSVLVSSNTQSISTTTGALVVTGGVGVSGAINTAGNITSSGTISAGATVSANTSMYTPQLYGTSTPSGNILIDGTSNATRGHVLLAPSGGNVGIGTTTPTAILDVFGGTSLTGNGRGINLMAENAYSSGPVDYAGGKITIKAGRGYVYGGAGDVSIAAGDSSSGGTGATLVLGGAPYQTAGTATLTGGGGWNGMGNVTIQGGASTPVGYVLLQPSGGKVGIGTSTPAYPLHVVGVAGIGDGTIRMGGSGWGEVGAVNIGINNSVGYSNSIAVGNTNNTGAGDSSTALGFHNSAAADASTAVGFYNTSGQHGVAVGYMNSASQSNGVAIGISNTLSAANTIAIGNGITNAVASSLMIGPSNTAKMTILSSGNVGVGTTSPAYALSVSGDVNVTGNFRVNGAVFTGVGGGAMSGVTSISNASGDITLAPTAATGAVQVNSGTASTSPSTGALVVSGGIGASGGIYSGGAISAGSSVYAVTSMFSPQLYGTSTPSGNILIDGTSNATKGNVILASAGGKVGAGTASPSATLHVVGADGASSSSPHASPLFTVAGGNGFATGNGNGGSISISAGGSSGTGTAGTVLIMGGAGASAGGSVTIAGGSGNTGGDLVLKSGDNWARQGANAVITVGAAGTINTGSVTIQSGNSNGSAGSNTGSINIFTPSANAGFTATAGDLNLTAGNGQFGGTGGAVNITAGNGGATNVNGSNVVITPGAKGGSGSDGSIILAQSRGKVAIGTSTPAEKLHVVGNIAATGQIAGGSQTITGGTTSIDWNNGNAIMTDYDCGSPLQFANLRDGGSYALVVTGTGTAQCNFSTTTTGTGAATVNYRFKPANGVRTSSSYTVYTLLRVGTTVLVSWTSGF